MRDAFLLDPSLVFLNHGSYGACPRRVFDDYQRWQRDLENNPVDFLARRSAALLAHARARLVAHVGARAADLAFVTNATTGVGVVARSLDLQAGDEVLATDHEYGACDAAFALACRDAGAQYRHVEIPLPYDPDSFVDRMLAAATPRTRLIFTSHISSPTAIVFPVAELCARARERGIRTLVDGAHAPGQLALDIDAVGADFYVGNAHKWLCAPKGSGFLHARAEHHAALRPPVVSWGTLADEQAPGDSVHDAYTGATTLERRLQWQGTRDLAAFLAVPAAIDFQQRHDWPAWRSRCHALACETRRRVAARNGLPAPVPDAAHAQMVLIAVRADDAAALQRWLLQQHRIEVAVPRHRGSTFVRVSLQAYNTQADCDALVAALAEAKL